MQKKTASINVDDNVVREKELFISEAYKQVYELKENIINSNLIIKSLRDRLDQLNIPVTDNLDVIAEKAIDVAIETNFVSTDNRIEDLEQIAKNAEFELNSLKDIIKEQKDKIQKLQYILDQNLSNKVGNIEQNNKKIGMFVYESMELNIQYLLNKIEQNNKKIEMLIAKSEELNVQLPSNLTYKNKIPVLKTNNLLIDKLDILELDDMLKQKSAQINNLHEIIKKQESQIIELSAKLDSIKSNLVETAEQQRSQLISLKQIVEKNNRKIEFFTNLFKDNKYLELPKDLITTSEIKNFRLNFNEQQQDIKNDILPRFSHYTDEINKIIKKQNDQINKLKGITSQTIENLYERKTIGFRALTINQIREEMNFQNLTASAKDEKHLTQQLVNNYKLESSDVIKFEKMAQDVLNDEEISSVINQFNTDRKKFFKTKIESENAEYDDWFYNKSFLWSDLIDNKNEVAIYNTLKKIYKNTDYDEGIFDISEYPLFLFAYLISMADNYREYSEIINKMVGNNKDLEKIFNALQSIIVTADPELTEDQTMLNKIGYADQKLVDFSLLRKRAQFITTQYFNQISSNITSMQDKCRLDEDKNDIKSAENIDNEISELEKKENEIRKAKLVNKIIELKYKNTDKSVTLDELINGISYNSAAVYQLKKSDKSLVDTIDDELNKFKYEMNNKINEMKIKKCANIAKNDFIGSEEFNNLKKEDASYQNLISENQNLMAEYSDPDKINDTNGNKVLINILKKELALGDIKKCNLFDAIIKKKDCEPDCFNIDKLDDQISDSEANDLQINNNNITESGNQNKISNNEQFPFEKMDNNDKNDQALQEQIKSLKNPFQFFSELETKESFLSKYSKEAQSKQNDIDRNNIPDMNNNDDAKTFL